MAERWPNFRSCVHFWCCQTLLDLLTTSLYSPFMPIILHSDALRLLSILRSLQNHKQLVATSATPTHEYISNMNFDNTVTMIVYIGTVKKLTVSGLVTFANSTVPTSTAKVPAEAQPIMSQCHHEFKCWNSPLICCSSPDSSTTGNRMISEIILR